MHGCTKPLAAIPISMNWSKWYIDTTLLSGRKLKAQIRKAILVHRRLPDLMRLNVQIFLAVSEVATVMNTPAIRIA